MTDASQIENLNLQGDSQKPTDNELAGYLHPMFASSFAEFGQPVKLPRSGGWFIKRMIPGFPYCDGMGCYPTLSCRDWLQLGADLDEIASEIVSLSAVINPFGNHDEDLLKRTFQDRIVAFKRHYVTDLTRSPKEFIAPRHLRNVKRATQAVKIEIHTDPSAYLNDWIRLYSCLIERHSITDLRKFSDESFRKLLQVPGMVMFRAVLDDEAVGITLWFMQGEVAYYHLGSFSEAGYKARAGFALFWNTIQYFADLRLRWLHLGGREGAKVNAQEDDGLSDFKSGWSTGTKQAFFCGRIFNREIYAQIVKEKAVLPTNYFPAYRLGEFSESPQASPNPPAR
jgi:hypothetical protein